MKHTSGDMEFANGHPDVAKHALVTIAKRVRV